MSPSGDRLLASVAAAYDPRAGGLVLTGMGEDGARGLLAIHQAGGTTLAQDEASSVVYGMPEAAVRLGATRRALPLQSLSHTVRRLSGKLPVPPRGTRI